jgi:hypothetical protein
MAIRRYAGVCALLGMVLPAPASAISLQFDYSLDSSGFFTAPRRAVLEAAGSYFSTLLTDTLSAITSGGVNQFTGRIVDPGTLAEISLPGLSVPADTLIVYAGGNATLGSTLGFGGFGGFQVSGTQAFLDNARSRGETGPTSGPLATEFAPWGGMLVFNSSLNWYADPDVTTTEAFSGHDLYSVALHELGHVLGLGVAASWFRLVSGGVFTGSAAMAAHGGPVPLTADGNHWAEGVSSGGQEAAMDPTLLVGSRKTFTALDVAALDDIGWDVQPPSTPMSAPVQVPLPPPAIALLAAFLAVAGARRAAALRPARS